MNPHPEGGWYRRVYTSPLSVPHPTGRGRRPSATVMAVATMHNLAMAR
ncbi:cupin domain-containing protein [Streptomyces sp. NPDC058289]